MSKRDDGGACPVCALLYANDYAPDQRFHKSYHAKWMRPRRPKPEPRLAAYQGDVRVNGESPRWLHRLVYDRALALKRDEHFDFPQWDKNGPPKARSGRDLHAWLLVEDLNVPVGIAGFTWTEWTDHESGWHMFMAWVADPWRRKSVMTRRWPHWRLTYGNFTLETPLSDSMEAFIIKMDPTKATVLQASHDIPIDAYYEKATGQLIITRSC